MTHQSVQHMHAYPPAGEETGPRLSRRAPRPSALDQRFERMFREYAPYVRRVMPRMGVRPADLDDATQEVFLAVHRALPRFEGRSSERTWIYGICIRVCSNYRQRAHRRREQLVAVVPERGDDKTPERDARARRRLARLDMALGELPDGQRAAFVLHEIELLSVNEIAEALACSKFTIYTRLRAAQRRIRASVAAAERQERSHA